MDNGFDRVDTDIRELPSEMNARFDRIDARFESMQQSIQRTMLGMLATIVTGFLVTNL